MKILAKSSGSTLSEHTEKVLECISALQASGAYPDIPDAWWKALRYAGLLHDIGKLDPVFQKWLRGRKARKAESSFLPNKEKCSQCIENPPLPHSLFGLFFIKAEFLPLNDELKEAVLSAAAFHHWRENFPDYLLGASSADIGARAEKLMECRSCYEDLIKIVKEQFRKLVDKNELSLDIIGFNEDVAEDLAHNELGNSGLVTPPYSMIFLPARIKSVTVTDERMRVFVAGNLIRADHFASYIDQNPAVQAHQIEIGEWASYEDMRTALEKKFKTRPWQVSFIERKPDVRKNSLIVIAPTGAGKTEFAYLWGAGRKLFFVLPMRVAANCMYERISRLLKSIRDEWEKNVSLLHGDAALILRHMWRDSNALPDSETEGESRQAVDIARHLGHPYIVCTADQIAPSALRFPGFERIYAALMGANVVIDEIQAYDPRAAAIVTHLIQQVIELEGRVLLMTATLPGFVRTRLEKQVGVPLVNLLETEEYKTLGASSRHTVRLAKYDGNPSSIVNSLIEAARQGKKVLVVMNTVNAAREMYVSLLEQLKEAQLDINHILLHSRYTLDDRKEKEAQVFDLMPNKENRPAGGCIVIATQVVEASLDLDADMLFTEAAPADSLIQRMGRVNRRYALKEGAWSPRDAANVVILVRSADKDVKDSKKAILLGSGVGLITSAESRSVYDFEFTLLSLAVLMVMREISLTSIPLSDQEIEGRVRQLIAELKHFEHTKKDKKQLKQSEHTNKDKKRKEAKYIANQFAEKIKDDEDCRVVLSERDKQRWVDITYRLLEENPVGIGSYIKIYEETLDILDHGYCSDRKNDAQHLFRQVSDDSIVPVCLRDEFYEAVAKCVATRGNLLSYLDLADKVISKYVVNAPWYKVKDSITRIEIDDILSRIENLAPNILDIRRAQLGRWLSGIYIADIGYDRDMGLQEREND